MKRLFGEGLFFFFFFFGLLAERQSSHHVAIHAYIALCTSVNRALRHSNDSAAFKYNYSVCVSGGGGIHEYMCASGLVTMAPLCFTGMHVPCFEALQCMSLVAMHALPLRPCNACSSFEAFYMYLEPNCVTVSIEPLKQGIACICQQNRRCTPKRVLLCSDEP